MLQFSLNNLGVSGAPVPSLAGWTFLVESPCGSLYELQVLLCVGPNTHISHPHHTNHTNTYTKQTQADTHAIHTTYTSHKHIQKHTHTRCMHHTHKHTTHVYGFLYGVSSSQVWCSLCAAFCFPSITFFSPKNLPSHDEPEVGQPHCCHVAPMLFQASFALGPPCLSFWWSGCPSSSPPTLCFK